MFAKTSLILTSFILTLPLPATDLSATGKTHMEPPVLELELSPESFEHADTLSVTVRITIADGWHINSLKPEDEFLIPTRLDIKGMGLGFRPPQFPEAVKKLVPVMGKELSMYEGKIEARTSIWKQGPGADLNSLEAELYYQACSDKICLRPTSVKIRLIPQEAGKQQVLKDFSGSGKPSPAGTTQAESSDFEKPLLLLILFLLGGGLALNLTPCVYPLMAVTISIFGSQGSRSLGSRVTMASLYVLGIMATFSALGVVSAFSGKLFGSTLQTPAAQMIIAGIFIALALSSFGLFEIRLPMTLMGRATAASNTGGYLGGLLGGLFAGILASPCIGPFILALIIYVAEKGSMFTGLWMFATLALGMGLPYLVLGVSTGMVQKLPRSGNWMTDVKKVLGIVLLALANYYLRGIIGEKAYLVIFGALLMYAGFYVNPFRKMPDTSKLLAALIKTAALIAILVGINFFAKALGPGFSFSSRPETSTPAALADWKAFSPELLSQAEDRPVIIDFQSQIWCAACREMEEKTFSHPEVKALLSEFLLLTVDVDKHPQKNLLIEKYAVIGVPTLILINSQGTEVDRIVGFLEAGKFIARVKEKVGGVI
ncbi:cytochrome c biogenesis protein CcdA [Fibrobacterota bacterium]